MSSARAGEIVTCPNGHEIATLTGPIGRGQTIMSALFTDWRDGQPEGKPGTQIMPCGICGERYIRSTGGAGWQIHIGDRWVP